MDEFSWGNTRLVVGEGKEKKVLMNDDEKKCCYVTAGFHQDEDWDLNCCCMSCWCHGSSLPIVKLVDKEGERHFGIVVEHANESETCCRILCRRNADCQSPKPQPHILEMC